MANGKNVRLSTQQAFRVAKAGSPEFFGTGCKNHKQTNQIRYKKKLRNISKRQGN